MSKTKQTATPITAITANNTSSQNSTSEQTQSSVLKQNTDQSQQQSTASQSSNNSASTNQSQSNQSSNQDNSSQTNTSTDTLHTGGCSTSDTTIPKVSRVATYDSNSNGYIDMIQVYFNTHMDQKILSTNGFSVDGYTILSGSWNNYGTYSCPDSRASYARFNLKVQEKNSFDTDITPVVKYNASAGQLKSLSGKTLEAYVNKAEDGANAVLISAIASDSNNQAGIQGGDKVVLTFSEAVKPYTIKDGSDATLTTANLNQTIILNMKVGVPQHSWLDGSGKAGIAFSSDKKSLTITLSTNGGLPTVSVGDTVNIGSGLSTVSLMTLNGENYVTDLTSSSRPVTISGTF